MSPRPQAEPAWRFVLVALLAGGALGALLPAISSYLAAGGVDEQAIGLVGAAYFAAQGLGALYGGRILRARSTGRVAAGALLVSALLAWSFPSFVGLPWYGANRVLSGLVLGVFMTGVQTSIMQSGASSRISALYALAFGVGFSLGPAGALRAGDALASLPFVMAAGCLSVAAVLCLGLRSELAPKPTLAKAALGDAWLPLLAVLAYGLCEAALFAMFPVFWLSRVGSAAGMGIALSVFGIGSLVSVVPITLLAQRLGQAATLGSCALVGAASLSLLGVADGELARLAWCFTAGAAVGPTYALSLAMLAERNGDAAGASSHFTISFSLGSILGPLLTSLVISHWSARQTFLPLVFALGALGWIALRSAVREVRSRGNEATLNVPSEVGKVS